MDFTKDDVLRNAVRLKEVTVDADKVNVLGYYPEHNSCQIFDETFTRLFFNDIQQLRLTNNCQYVEAYAEYGGMTFIAVYAIDRAQAIFGADKITSLLNHYQQQKEVI